MKEKINEIYEKINSEYSGKRAKDIAVQISKFHRIQISPWFSEAIFYCKNLLKKYGIKSFIHEFPSDGKKKYFTMNSFKMWNCKKGILYLKEPINKKIADFDEMKLNVIPRSGKVKGIFDVVYYDGGKKDLKNKIILTSNQEFIKEEFLKENKVKGVIFFGMNEIEGVREKGDLMDALQYVSFWPVNENKFFGFIISPKKGEELKKILIKNKKLKVYVEIDSEFKDGKIEVLDIFFEGKLDEEVWGIAHLCHPSPFINDNASGCGAILELSITFKKLFENKILGKPLRSIRFLLLPEMTGTYAYLKYREKELDKIKGAINLDMVGEDQEKCKSTFCLIKEPLLIRSYISYLGEMIFEYIEEKKAKTFYESDYIPYLRKKVTEYSGGSDHYILIDPTIGIPCVMLGQWPDKFYHTSFDDEDKISEESLKFSGSFAGTLLYYIASLNDEDIEKIAEKMNFLFNKKIYEMKIKEENPLKEKLYYLSHRNALNSLKIFKKDFEPQKFLKEIGDYKIDFERKGKILKRTFKAPLYFKTLFKKMDDKEIEWIQKNLKEKKHLRHFLELFIYYIDGKRSFNEICEIIRIETGKDENLFLKKIYKILEKYKFLI